MPTKHTIKIVVVPATNQLSYSHTMEPIPPRGRPVTTSQGPTVHVSPGDVVRWKSDNEKFAIHFKDNRSPFVSGNFSRSGKKGGFSVEETVKLHVDDTSYPYMAVSAKKSGPKHLVTDDPEMIVDGTGGGA